jgi:CheY-like chemotaxis protein
MNQPCLLAYLEDPPLEEFIQKLSEDKGMDFYFATFGEQLTQYVNSFVPFMMLVDMTGLETSWLFRHVAEVKNAKPRFPIVALTGKDEESMKNRLESAGCNAVLNKKEFTEKFPELVESYLSMGS